MIGVGVHIIIIGQAKQAPHWGVQSRFRVLYVSVCMSWYAKARRRNYVAQKRACSKSSFGRLKPTCEARVIHFDYTLEQLYHGRKRNVRLEMRNLKQAELQRLQNRGKKG